MITFKQFLLEGGKATKSLGTVPATKRDMVAAFKHVSAATGLPVEQLKDRLLGSGRLTYNGHQDESGDVDLAIQTDEIDRQIVLDKLTELTGAKPVEIGGNTYSFAVPTFDGRKVQVDLMFVPDLKWAKFSHHSSEFSKHKSGVRNELLHSLLKFSMEPGKDVRIKDENGNDVARASRSYKLIDGVERIFKVAPKRKDGKGRVKGVEKVDPDQVEQVIKELGRKETFDKSPDVIRDPEKFAKLLFGGKVNANQLMSVESLIELIKRHRKDEAPAIFKDAVRNIKRLKFKVPDELKSYE
jgi:hypothetical protein